MWQHSEQEGKIRARGSPSDVERRVTARVVDEDGGPEGGGRGETGGRSRAAKTGEGASGRGWQEWLEWIGGQGSARSGAEEKGGRQLEKE